MTHNFLHFPDYNHTCYISNHDSEVVFILVKRFVKTLFYWQVGKARAKMLTRIFPRKLPWIPWIQRVQLQLDFPVIHILKDTMS